MYPIFFITLMVLLLSGCSDQAFSEQGVLDDHVLLLKSLCQNEQTCLDQIDGLVDSCRQSHPLSSDKINFHDTAQIKDVGEFGACIIMQMDQSYQNRFAELIPVKETGVEVVRPSANAGAKGLLVRLMKDQIRVTEKSQPNKDFPVDELKHFIENQNVVSRYSSVLLFVDEDADTGDMIEVMDIFKSAGLEDIYVSAKK